MPVSKSLIRRLNTQAQKSPVIADLPVLPKKAQTYLYLRFPSLYLGREERKLIRALEKSVTRLGKTLGFTPVVQQPFNPDTTPIDNLLPVSRGIGGQYIWLSDPKEYPKRILMVVHLPLGLRSPNS